MTILARNELIALIKRGIIKVHPFHKSQVGAGSIDLHLDNVFRVFRKPYSTFHVKDDADYKSITHVIKIDYGTPMEIMPGELVTGVTKETIELPKSIAGWIEGRSRFARIGLMTHLSSGYIHPGTINKTVLEIANMSPMPLAVYPGTKVCQVVLEEVRGDSVYRGRFHRQKMP